MPGAKDKPKTIRFPRGTTNVSGEARLDRYGYVLTLSPVRPEPRHPVLTRQENQRVRMLKRLRHATLSGPQPSYRARHKRPLRRKGARG